MNPIKYEQLPKSIQKRFNKDRVESCHRTDDVNCEERFLVVEGGRTWHFIYRKLVGKPAKWIGELV